MATVEVKVGRVVRSVDGVLAAMIAELVEHEQALVCVPKGKLVVTYNWAGPSISTEITHKLS